MGKLLKVYLMPHPPIMVHEVGRGEEQKIKSTVDAAVEISKEIGELKPDTVIIVAPPHGPAFSDAMNIYADDGIEGDLGNFRAPQVSFQYEIDAKLTDMIMGLSEKNNIPVVPITEEIAKKYRISQTLDHGSMVPLYFINRNYGGFKLVNIIYGILSNEQLYHFGKLIRQSVEECAYNAVLIASGDLSHRLTLDAPAGYSPFGKKFDREFTNLLLLHDVQGILDMDRELIEGAGECGYRSAVVMEGSLDGCDVKGRIMSYEGPFGVGYCAAGFDIINISSKKSRVEALYSRRRENISMIRNNEDNFVRLARHSLEHYINTGRIMDIPEGLPSEMFEKQAGTFVSIKKQGQLRGCIGTIIGIRDNIAEEIIENAVSAGTRDPRFYPVEKEELDELEYSVDVLGIAEPISSKDMLDPKRYGVIVRKGSKSGLLLPNLEGIDDVDEQVGIALQKAGIGKDESYTMERFEVIRHR